MRDPKGSLASGEQCDFAGERGHLEYGSAMNTEPQIDRKPSRSRIDSPRLLYSQQVALSFSLIAGAVAFRPPVGLVAEAS